LSAARAGIPKQAYNDALDRRLWDFLDLGRGTVMTVRGFCAKVAAGPAEIAAVCAHPGEAVADRETGLRKGLAKLGIQTETVPGKDTRGGRIGSVSPDRGDTWLG
jgi:hypothetical protein